MIKDIILPDLGEGIESVEVSEVLVKAGDTINTDDSIIILESDKASMEIPTTDSGKVTDVLVKTGDEIGPGATLIKVDTGNEEKVNEEPAPEETSVKQDPPTPEEEPIEKSEPRPPQQAPTTPGKKPLASPSVRRFARELGANLAHIEGSGAKGRITKEDVQTHIKSILSSGPTGATSAPTLPPVDFSQWGEIESVALSKIKRITGERLQQAWQTIPHVTQFDEADITDLDMSRKSLKALNENEKVRITFLPFLMKASIQVLKEMPEFNASLDHTGQQLVYKKYYHIGVAVDTPNGLVVPVIHDVDKKGFAALSEELVYISKKSREKKLLPDDMKGGCFTISSLGGISGTGFTPIVNPPEVAILGVSRSRVTPVYQDGNFVPRTILPFTLSYDHRVIDGAQAARFTKRLAELLSDYSQLQGLELT